MRFFTAIVFVFGAAAGIYWAVEKHTTVQLHQQLDSIKDQTDDIVRLRREHERLLGLQSTQANLNNVRDRIRDEGAQPGGHANEGIISLRPGAWTPASEWKNQGQATPEAAVETMLWAAAGGDVKTLKDTLALAPDTQSKATDLLASLPTPARQSIASPEDLMALLVAGNVPLDSAQVVAKQTNPDGQVIEYLRLKDSDGRTRQVYLTLLNVSESWRLTVPASALVQMAQIQSASSVP
jgi:hypothetical protein